MSSSGRRWKIAMGIRMVLQCEGLGRVCIFFLFFFG